METFELARHFMTVLEEGDVDKARACLQPDAKVWHNFDDVEQTVDENMALLAWMTRKSQSRAYEITRLEEIPAGYLQQHILTIENMQGETMRMHACVLVRVRDGLIERIEEYLDPAAVAKLS